MRVTFGESDGLHRGSKWEITYRTLCNKRTAVILTNQNKNIEDYR